MAWNSSSGSSEKTICTPRSVLQGLLKVQHSFHALSCKWNRSQHGVGDILNYHHWQSCQTSDEVKFSLPENISVFCLDGFFALLEMCQSTGRRGVSKVPFRLTANPPQATPIHFRKLRQNNHREDRYRQLKAWNELHLQK